MGQPVEQPSMMEFEIARAMLEEADVPDTQEAFEQFKILHPQEKEKKQIWLKVALWTAACAAALLVVYATLPDKKQVVTSDKIVYKATKEAPSEPGILLQGEIISLNTKIARQQGFSLNNEGEICYSQPDDIHDHQTTTLIIPQGKVARLTLDDGTKVDLSANSRLLFPQRFLRNHPRRVELHGEAFFDVSHYEDWPFIVDGGTMQVSVQGTTFNMRNFANELPKVTLVSGRVQVCVGEKVRATLLPNQQAMLDGSNNLKVNDADIDVVTSWKEGLFYFDGQSLRDIMVEIGRWYNMNVIFKSEQHIMDRLHFNSERKNGVESIVGQLNLISSAHIEVSGNTLTVY